MMYIFLICFVTWEMMIAFHVFLFSYDMEVEIEGYFMVIHVLCADFFGFIDGVVHQ